MSNEAAVILSRQVAGDLIVTAPVASRRVTQLSQWVMHCFIFGG